MLRRDPGRTAIACDFDGTLAPIVSVPSAARPLAGAADLLDELAGTYLRIGVLSGRPVEFLQRFFPPSIVLVGLYGLEIVRDGERYDHPESDAWRKRVQEVCVRSGTAGPVGMRTEDKGLSLTFHFREHPEASEAVQAWAADQARASGLVLREAKMSFELHPPIEANKGTALTSWVGELEGLTTMGFVGDDVGDRPAFDALDRLAADGVAAVRVAVRGPEEDPELIERADATVDGPQGAFDLLASLR